MKSFNNIENDSEMISMLSNYQSASRHLPVWAGVFLSCLQPPSYDTFFGLYILKAVQSKGGEKEMSVQEICNILLLVIGTAIAIIEIIGKKERRGFRDQSL